MRKILIINALILFSLSTFGQGKENEKEWIQTYKDQVFYNGLLKGLESKEVTDKIISLDKSFYNPVFIILHGKAISKGSDYLVEMIRKDSIEREGRVAEPASGRRPFLVALRFYQSKKLNQMAKEEYNKWMKIPNKQKLINEANKAY
ncbi:hypothetical protein [Pedobacter nototheniae]|uniref:hypothetical protein n=1 Tax=Pedobacter nototheniae TaxID=2488994 RepID=UPI00103F86C9|nr:hypothetical protein [Pedobacter nototheniae]